MQRPLAHENSLSEQGRGAADREHGASPERGRQARAEGLPGQQLGGQGPTRTLLQGHWGQRVCKQSRGNCQRGARLAPPPSPLPLPLQGSPWGNGVFRGNCGHADSLLAASQLYVSPTSLSSEGSSSPPAPCHPRSCGQEEGQRRHGQVWQCRPSRPSLTGHGDRPLTTPHTRWAGTSSRCQLCPQEGGTQRCPQPGTVPQECGGRRPLRPQRSSRQDCRGRGGQGVSRWGRKGQGGGGFWSQVQAMHRARLWGQQGGTLPDCGSSGGNCWC